MNFVAIKIQLNLAIPLYIYIYISKQHVACKKVIYIYILIKIYKRKQLKITEILCQISEFHEFSVK